MKRGATRIADRVGRGPAAKAIEKQRVARWATPVKGSYLRRTKIWRKGERNENRGNLRQNRRGIDRPIRGGRWIDAETAVTAAGARAEPGAAVFVGATDGGHAHDESHCDGRTKKESSDTHAHNLRPASRLVNTFRELRARLLESGKNSERMRRERQGLFRQRSIVLVRL
jgi:hypothetical protein